MFLAVILGTCAVVAFTAFVVSAVRDKFLCHHHYEIVKEIKAYDTYRIKIVTRCVKCGKIKTKKV